MRCGEVVHMLPLTSIPLMAVGLLDVLWSDGIEPVPGARGPQLRFLP
jgi:hypothetical protein